jgi:hypothetical protein
MWGIFILKKRVEKGLFGRINNSSYCRSNVF